MDWEKRIRDLMVKVSLYQLGMYPSDKLDFELSEFFRDVVKPLCIAIRRNGGICYHEQLENMSPSEAVEEVVHETRSFERLGRTGKMVAQMLRLSIELGKADKMNLNEKILLFDKIVHTEHATGAFREEYLPEERSIFGVDIGKIHIDADKEIEKIVRGEKPAPDPPQSRRYIGYILIAVIGAGIATAIAVQRMGEKQ